MKRNQTPFVVDNFARMTNYELMEITGLTKERILQIKHRYNLVHDEETQERYEKQIKEHFLRGIHRSFRYDKLTLLMGGAVKRNISLLSSRALNAGKYLRYKYNYFNDGNVKDVFYYDKETRRCVNEQYFADKYRFRFEQADD